MKKRKHIRINKLKMGIIFLVFSMLVGFAALNTRLEFYGTTNLAFLGDQDFKVYFSKVLVNDVGRTDIINYAKNSFTVTYSDINQNGGNIVYTVKNTSNSYYADVSVTCNMLKNDGTTFLYNEENYVEKKFRINPGQSFTSDLKILLPDIVIDSTDNNYENSYTCSLVTNSVGISEELRNPLLDLEVGEEYCFEEECFYIISNDKNGIIKMISKYNLYVGNYVTSSDSVIISKSDPLYGKQNVSAIGLPVDNSYPRIGGVAYSLSKNPNYESSNVKPYVDEYVTYLKKITGLDVNGTLITNDELKSLGCDSSADTCKNANWDWVSGRTYWTMSQGQNNDKGEKTIYLVGADGYFNASSGMDNKDLSGVRPVITIDVSTKNPNVTFVSGNGENVGDELCIGTECFYVLDYDGSNYTLFAKYNLYTGRICKSSKDSDCSMISSSDSEYGHQSNKAVGDKNGFPTYGTLTYTEAVSAMNNYSTFINETYNMHVTSRGINLDELVDTIGCTVGYTNNHGCDITVNNNVKYDWITNTTFWTGAKDGNDPYLVGGDGFFKALNGTNLTNISMRGARPVVVVPVSDIKMIDHTSPSYSYPSEWHDNGVFSKYYENAYSKLQTMSTEEKVGQLLVMSYTSQNDALNAIQNYHVGGVLFFENAFTNKTLTQVQTMTSSLQSAANIPLMTAVDEEGGRVVRISPNLNLVGDLKNQYPNLFFTNINNKNAWKLASTLYAESGNNFDLVVQAEQVRNNFLKSLGINMNFAPVVDIATPPAYISDRSFGDNPTLVAQYAENVIKTGKNSGVSHSLKHFPGYGNNQDTHGSSSVDETSMDDLKNIHLVPFISGINAGANSVMISHNTVAALDKNNPASLSYAVHNLLFEELGFTGLAITDDLSMKAISDNVTNQYVKAFTAGNHILLSSSEYAKAHGEILAAINSGNIPMSELNKRVFKVLAWKYYIGLLK